MVAYSFTQAMLVLAHHLKRAAGLFLTLLSQVSKFLAHLAQFVQINNAQRQVSARLTTILLLPQPIKLQQHPQHQFTTRLLKPLMQHPSTKLKILFAMLVQFAHLISVLLL